MTDITITSTGPSVFDVQVRDGDVETSHRVTVPAELEGVPELAQADPERAVRASFDFLLEREPASAILPRFSLADISRFFPEYEAELSRRLA